MRPPPPDYSLMFVTDDRVSDDDEFIQILEATLRGGATIVQLREKKLNTKRFYRRAVETKAVCDRYEVPLLVNDRIDIALSVNADGVHLGQSDMPPSVARKLIGDDKIIGWSVGSFEQAEEANGLEVDYLGLSPVFATNTKTLDLEPPLGLEGIEEIRKISGKPLVSIGGIDEGNAAAVIESGSDGIAVISAISRSCDPERTTTNLKEILCRTGSKR
ncbi:MAG: thiamine phosphate synthase [Verrucomicrobiota bacterium]